MLNILRALFCVFCAVFVLSGSVWAAEDVYTVSGVYVDVKAENAVAAREKAFTQAQLAAFSAVAERMMGEQFDPSYTPPSVDVISPMIKDFEITNERLSAVQYIGTYTFRFDGNAVRQHFHIYNTPTQQIGGYGTMVNPGEQAMPVMPASGKPMLVLPFYKMGAQTVLWQVDNPWLQAWSRQDLSAGAPPLTVPMGDIPDVADIGDEESLTYNTANLTRMLARYGADEAVIMIAVPGVADSMGVPTDLQVMVYITRHAVPQFSHMVTVTPDANAPVGALFAKAVQEVWASLRGGWQAQDQQRAQQAYTMMPRPSLPQPYGVAAQPVVPARQGSPMAFRVSFSTMQQWMEARQALRRVQALQDMQVKTVTPREAQVEFNYAGDENSLRMMMAQAGLTMGGSSGYTQGGRAPVFPVTIKKYDATIR